MEITYKSRKLERECTDAKVAERSYGKEMAEKIQIAHILEIVDYH